MLQVHPALRTLSGPGSQAPAVSCEVLQMIAGLVAGLVLALGWLEDQGSALLGLYVLAMYPASWYHARHCELECGPPCMTATDLSSCPQQQE